MPVEQHVIHLEDGRLAADTPATDVQALVDRALAHGGNGIVVHFHGGLVKYANGMSTAEKLHGKYLEAGAYPVFFVWESGLIETITHNLGEIGHEKVFKLLWKRLTNIVLRKLGQNDTQRAAGDLPPVDDSQVQAAIDAAPVDDGQLLYETEPAVPTTVRELTAFEQMSLENELLMDPELTVAIEEISNGLRPPSDVEADRRRRAATVVGSTATLMDPQALDLLVERPDPSARGLISTATMIRAVVSIAVRIISRFAARRDHGFHATVVEEILRGLYVANVGGVIWDQMKKDIADAFGPDRQVHGGTAFLAALNDAIDPTDPPRITLVGHSTGAVYISEFVEAAADMLPASVQFGVVFEAPASTFAKTSATLLDHGARISDFRMFTMDDQREREDRLVPVLYPQSLLYFVSGVVEPDADTPVVGMHRFYDGSRFPDDDYLEVKVVRDFVNQSADRAAWSITPRGAPEGQRTTAARHTDFDDEDAATLDSVKHILSSGF